MLYNFLVTLTILGDAYWAKSEEPKCIKQCPQRVIHTPPLTVSCTNGRDVGSTCSFECTDEGQLEGETEVECLDTESDLAQWASKFPVCTPRCPGFASTEGRNIDCTKDRLAGSECEFSCSTGFKLQGNSTLFCKVHKVEVEGGFLLSNDENRDAVNMEFSKYKQIARWNLEPPTCRRKPCPNLSKLSNGQLSCKG